MGGGNTASGASALISNTMGDDNSAAGVQALFSNTTGSKNTAVGSGALFNGTGSKNIAIGFKAGTNLASGNNNIYLGHAGGVSESKTMRLGSVQTSTFIAGVATANVSGTTVMIDANGHLGVALSSARYKRDIAAMGARSAGVFRLRPVTFAYRDGAPGTVHYGLIAEEVAAVYPELVTRTVTGEVQAVRYQELIPMLLNELQHQQQELAELRALVGQGRGRQVEPEALISRPTVAVGGADSSLR